MSVRLVWAVFLLLLVSVAAWLVGTALEEPSVEAFLEEHWSFPIPPQGRPPEDFSSLERSLAPASCAQCHPAQYEQWSGSLHSHTMGPGIRWQLQLADAGTAKSCLRCHAPMSEQLALLSQERGWSRATSSPPAHVPADLHSQGLVCAACHLRAHNRFGPPPNKPVRDEKAHGGFTAHAAFGDSRFCATCHQFAEDGPRLNGKLREDTYNQWRATGFAEEGQSCQACHMPERRHLWKGIHDPDMTRSALTVQLDTQQYGQGMVTVRAEVTNTGAGHHFPTYLVPDVVLRLEYIGPDGGTVELARHTIAWRANVALTEEIFDQRLPAGEKRVLFSEGNRFETGGRVRLRVSVAPRDHYVRTFESYLQANRNRLDAATRELILQAIGEARSAEYEFIAAERAVPPIAN